MFDKYYNFMDDSNMKMKDKIKIYPIILGFLLLGIQSIGLAQKLSFHASAGIASPKEKNINSGFETGFGFTLELNRRVSLLFDFGYWKSETIEESGKLMNGKLVVTPFLVSLRYSLLEGEAVAPYVFIGAGFVFSSFEIGEYITIPEITINQKIENGICLHAGAGGSFNVSSNFALFAEMVYLFRETTGETIITDMNFGVSTEEFSLSLSSFLLRFGIRYFF